MFFSFRNSASAQTTKHSFARTWVEKLSALGLSVVLLGGASLGISSCSNDTDAPTPQAQSASTTTSVPLQEKDTRVAPTHSAPLPTATLEQPAGAAELPEALPPSTIAPSLPPQMVPGAPLPQTNLDQKYAPLGVPTMTPPGTFKPFIFTTTFTREQTVQIHEKQVGEKMAKVGDAVPLAGEPVSTMGQALSGSSEFASGHEDTCVRAWVELSPGNWGTYATYVTGKECPAKTSHTYQLP